MKKNLCIIGSSGIPANYGGFETLVQYISKSISKDFNLYVFCSSKNYSTKLKSYNGAKLKYINLSANGFQGIFYDMISLYKSMSFSSNIIILGASGALALPILRLIFRNKKIATNIDGIEWKRDKWGFFEKIILKLSEFIACYSSDVIISDNKEIKNYIDKKYNIKSIYIPYGGNHVKNPKVNSNLIKFKSKDYAVKVCRIEPENNVEMVLEAFCKINHRNLVVIGNWSNSNYGKKLYNLYNNYRNIELLNPIYNQIELNKIRFNSNLYVHGHSAGGTNPSLVEAMFLDIPIICFDVKFNKYSTKNKALYFHDSKSLIKLLNSNFDLNSIIIASDLKKIAENEYIWKKISNSYIKIFNNN